MEPRLVGVYVWDLDDITDRRLPPVAATILQIGQGLPETTTLPIAERAVAPRQRLVRRILR